MWLKYYDCTFPLGSSSSGQNAGNADKMGISGVALWRLVLKWLYFFDEYWVMTYNKFRKNKIS